MSVKVSPANPPKPPLIGHVQGSFAEDTFKKRLPSIVQRVVEEIGMAVQSLEGQEQDAKVQEGKELMQRITCLKEGMEADAPLPPMLDDGAQDVKEWVLIQEKEFPKGTWFTVTWLFGECFTYRLIQAMLSLSTHWKTLDPFAGQKARTLQASQDSITVLGKRYVEDILGKKSGKEEAEVFREIALVCLWGNRADLSLLVHLDLAKTGEGTTFQLKSDEHAEVPILANDLDRVWEYVRTLRSGQIDVILDNAGFELFGDLLFADYLYSQGHARVIRLHGKAIPWFVSDVVDQDVTDLLHVLSQHEDASLRELATRWKGFLMRGIWIFEAHPFWTSPRAFWHLPEVSDLWEGHLRNSDFLVFKGDLNHRKLLYDCYWPHTTPFSQAIGPMGQSESDYPALLTLRTCKSDVVVGL
ncbi:hypothetical protein BJ684DRAFT_9666, partial [Piptocephalis cylindrospora]